MTITLENLKDYITDNHFISFNLDVNEKYQQNICDNNIFIQLEKNLLNLVTNIKKIKNNQETENISNLSKNSNESFSENNLEIENENLNDYEGIHQIDLKLSNIIDPSKYFIYTPNKNNSFIGSILCIIDTDYCAASEQSKKKMIQDFREKIGFDIDKNFKILNYKRKIKKSNLQDILLNGKYTDAELSNIHHYETEILRDSRGRLIQPEGLKVPEGHSITFVDRGVLRTESKLKSFTFLQHEIDMNDKKRDINVLKIEYLNLFLDNVGEIMEYKKSSQYISDNLKKTENPRLISP